MIAAVAVALVPVPRPLVEEHYSARLFPLLQHWATGMSNLVGVALFDLLLVGVALWWVGAIMIDIASHRSFPRVFLRIFVEDDHGCRRRLPGVCGDVGAELPAPAADGADQVRRARHHTRGVPATSPGKPLTR